MNITILGAGLSGISLAYFLQDRDDIEHIDIIEKDDDIAGLCRSIRKDGYTYDIGPHILFSKDKEMLELMLSVLDAKNDLKRSNQIIYKGRWVQYPFENDLSKLPKDDLDYCVSMFKANPYRGYEPKNMLQFFLKTFGEGITNTYLRPYNEKIWKYDPSFMDTQMVERIPQPTDEEIMRSASGETVDGYVHQLYFHFPSEGGIEAVPKGFARKLTEKCTIHLNEEVSEVWKTEDGSFGIRTNSENEYVSDRLISTIPIQALNTAYKAAPSSVVEHVNDLKYNSIIIAFVKTKEDLSGDNFAFMNPEKDIIFHRISKMDFLGDAYKSDSATYMVEVTYRKGDYTDQLNEEELKHRISDGMVRVGFAKELADTTFINITRHEYAYVIYDLKHKENMTAIRDYYKAEGIDLNGRFGNFEYWNMDKVLREAKNMAESF
ncbi:UDP-galactopyranose mutase [Pseudobutyrivibrio sp. YE44]|uniref:protoporphyrinogen/coproporphyrinogen oxidase n=1 Tax=Pseudobutyrivibrio sp. YE44 TaxID=1520802 RepID=UPI000887265A|nr:FAD-dependent oxidoreductase [Pseudobutyrivibrio sp. YE44]SDB28997.1 UDP-galactopyranose mutase [Pseudobutyrivibrio sp. YE44]